MATDRTYFVDLFGEIISRVRAEYDTLNDPALEPYYMYGHPTEMAKRLSFKDRRAVDKFRKFPLVGLITDFEEKHGESPDVLYSVSSSVIIVDKTDKNYISDARYVNTFKPILYPIYKLLISKLIDSAEFKTPTNLVEHNKTDRLFWGANGIYGNEGVIFNEHLDAIQIDFTDLKIYKGFVCQ